MKLKYCLMLCLFCIATSLQAQNVITVSKTGGDFTNPVDALQAIGTSLPAAGPANRYVVKFMPGRYSVTRPIVMQPYVDLEGSGRKTTLIRGAISWQFGGDTIGVQGVINAASHSEIRHLTVRNTWADSSAIGIGMLNTRGSSITDVRSEARGKATDSASWKYGIRIIDSKNVRLDRVTARGTSKDFTSCQGAVIRSSNVSINDSRLIAVGSGCSISLGVTIDDNSVVTIHSSVMRGEGSINGISASSASASATSGDTVLRIRHSELSGELFAFAPTPPASSVINVSHSQVSGPVRGPVTCFSVHDESLSPLGSDCLP